MEIVNILCPDDNLLEAYKLLSDIIVENNNVSVFRSLSSKCSTLVLRLNLTDEPNLIFKVPSRLRCWKCGTCNCLLDKGIESLILVFLRYFDLLLVMPNDRILLPIEV